MFQHSQVVSIIGGQWGDEGKGKIVDILAKHADIVARYGGGANAGHTIYLKDQKFVFHLLPSGALHEHAIGLLGNGMVIHLKTLLEEIQQLKDAGIEIMPRLMISHRAHLVLDHHLEIDGFMELEKGDKPIGTTKRGIGPAYMDKIARIGIQAGDLLDPALFTEKFVANFTFHQKRFPVKGDPIVLAQQFLEVAQPLLERIVDTESYLIESLQLGKKILVEGAQATMLDIDHGTYPYVTSSNTTIGGAVTGLGLPPKYFLNNIGVMKAYCTRVGEGPFPTELTNETGEHLRTRGGEFGATTGRPRRCGWFDVSVARYAVQLNGLTSINLTKLDVLDDQEAIQIGIEDASSQMTYLEMPGWKTSILGCQTFSDLPKNAQAYVLKIEELIGCPVKYIGTGPGREDMIRR